MVAEKGDSSGKKSSSSSDENSDNDEFLVIGMASDLKTGASVRILASAPTFKKAYGALEAMDSPDPSRVAIVQRKAVYRRKQQIATIPVEEDIIPTETKKTKEEKK